MKLTLIERKMIKDEKKRIKGSYKELNPYTKTHYRDGYKSWLTWRLIEIIERLNKGD